jgi:hypothetical protein
MEEEVFFLDLSLKTQNSQIIAYNRYCFSMMKNLAPLLQVPLTQLVLEKQEILQDENFWSITLTNRGNFCALNIWPRTPPAAGYVYFDDNYFCLFPGESRIVMVEWDEVLPAERRLTAQAWNSNQILVN